MSKDLIANAGTFSTSTSYSRSDVVLYNGTYYISTATSNQGNTPPGTGWATLSSPPVTTVTTQYTVVNNVSGNQTYTPSGTIDRVVYELNLTGATTITIGNSPVTSRWAELLLIVNPNGNQVTFPASSSAIVWRGGSVPTTSTTSSMVIKFGSTGVAPVRGDI